VVQTNLANNLDLKTKGWKWRY